jgi:hypothetical protein
VLAAHPARRAIGLDICCLLMLGRISQLKAIAYPVSSETNYVARSGRSHRSSLQMSM